MTSSPRRLAALLLIPIALGCAVPPPPANQDAGADGGIPDAGGRDLYVGFDAATPDLSLGLSAVGSASTLDLATWNLQSFPLASDTTVSQVAGVILDLDLDLVAVQEIMDMRDFQRVTTLLSEHEGILNSDNLLRTGFIYRSSVLTLDDQRELFVDNSYAFIRSPLRADFTATDPQGGGSYSFTAIVLHLKAGTTDDDQNQRRAANQALKDYLDAERTANPGRDYVVLGDFNDQLTDSASNNTLQVFLDASGQYRFLTLPLAQSGEWSLPAYHIMIDHFLVADTGASDFGGDQTQVLHLDEQLSGYLDTLSDHRPVVTVIEPAPWR